MSENAVVPFPSVQQSIMRSRIQERYILRLVQSSLENEDIFRWAEVIKIVEKMCGSLRRKSLAKLCQFLLQALITKPCDDRQISLRITLLCASYLQDTAKDKSPYELRFSALLERNILPSKDMYWALDGAGGFSILGAGRCMCIGPCQPGLPCGYNLEKSAFIALNAGDCKYLSALVRYGFWEGSMDNEDIPASIQYAMIWGDFWNYVRTVRSGRPADCQESRSRRTMVRHQLQENDGRMSENTRRGFRRIPLILKTLKAVALPEQSKDSYVDCLRTYFSVLPDPVVSVDEVEELLLHMPEEDRDRPVVDSLVNEFRDIFGQKPYQPRSLAHSSRCKIRLCLAANKSASMPKLVESLPLPKLLKAFVSGACERKLF